MSNPITITREVYDFLMGEGPLEGVWFGDLHEGLPGAFWWRGVLRSAEGWPEPAQGIEAGTAETVKLGSVHESPVAESDAPK